MSQLEQLAGQVKNLGPEELRAFRDWFVEYDSQVWDRQIETDAENGKLDALAADALRDHEQGRSTEL